MKISQDGARLRFYSERKKLEARQGDPLHDGVTDDMRRRIAREILGRTTFTVGRSFDFAESFIEDLNRQYGGIPGDGGNFTEYRLEDTVVYLELDDFFQVVETWAARCIMHRPSPAADINAINSLLADDRSSHRLVSVGTEKRPVVQVHKIDNEHLHKVLTDRTFELTRVAEFASAQNDYADAWRHYSSGDLDNALTDAHKAVESAAKVIIKKVDPASTPDDEQLGPLVTMMVARDIIPSELNHIANHLTQIFRGSGSLRNQAGAAHGSLEPGTPDASVALMGLRLSGTLIAFLAERWTQMKPTTS